MAAYTFRCRKCGEIVTIEHPMAEPHPKNHKDCGGELGRVFDSQAEVIYRSTGFIRTDRRFEAGPNDD